MELRLGGCVFAAGDTVVMGSVTKANEVMRGRATESGIADAVGVGMIEVAGDPRLVRRLRDRRPVIPIAVATGTPETARACVAAGADLLVGDALAEVAAAGGAGLACSDPERATAAGVRPDGILVDVGPGPVGRIEALAAAGRPVLVTPALLAPDEVGALAVTAVCAWLGAQVFRTGPDAAATREVLDMVASIKGVRPPAVARRGLS